MQSNANEAQKNTAEIDGDMKFSITNDANGQYVKVDTEQNLFEGKTIQEKQNLAKKIISDKFKGKVLQVGSEGKAYLNKRSTEEYAYPANRRMDIESKEAKMQAVPELDNLLLVSNFIENQSDDGRHPEATGGWNVYSTRFEVAGQMFVGEVKVMVTDRGYVFYDITKIKGLPVNSGLTENNSAAASGNPSTNSIPDNEPTVNNNSMQESGEYSSIDLQSTAEDNSRPTFTEPEKSEIYRPLTPEDRIEAAFGRDRSSKQKQIESIAEKFGMTVYWNERYSGAVYSPKDKSIRMNPNLTLTQAYMVVFKHEFTHHLEGFKGYDGFKNYLIKQSNAFEAYVRGALEKENGQAFEGTREEAIKAYTDIVFDKRKAAEEIPVAIRKAYTREEIEREIVADFTGEVLLFGENTEKSEQALLEVAETNRTFFQKIMDWIKDVISIIKGDPHNRTLEEDLRYLNQRIARVYDSAQKNTAKNSGEAKFALMNNTSDGKKAGRIREGMTDSKRYEILKNRAITLSQPDAIEYSKIIKNNPALLDKGLKTKEAEKILKKIGEEFGVFTEYRNNDVEIEFEFGKNNLSESMNKQKGNYDIYTQMLSCFLDVISNAVGIEIHNRNEEGYKIDRTLKNVYVLCSAFENSTHIIPVKLEVKEFYDKTNRLYVAVALDGIKKDRVAGMGVPNTRSHIRTSPVTISIRDLFSKINPKDREFLKYIPNEFLNEAQRKAKEEILAEESKTKSKNESTVNNNSMQKSKENTSKDSFSVASEEFTTKMNKLTADFKEGKISIDEYTVGVSKLAENERKVSGELRQAMAEMEKNHAAQYMDSTA